MYWQISMAKIALLSYGTRGDVQPFVALAQALTKRGHEVVLAAPSNYLSFVEKLGIKCHPIAGDTAAFLESPDGRRLLASGDVRGFFEHGRTFAKKHHAAMKADLRAAAKGAEVLVAGFITLRHGLCLAELDGVPCLGVMTFPIFPPSASFPNLLITTRAGGPRWLNRLTHSIFERAAWRKSDEESIRRWRSELGLGPWERPFYRELVARRVPMLHWYSRHVFEKPADWGPEHRVTGPIFLDTDPTIPPALERWLSQGPPPVFFGFGSIPMPALGRTTAMLEEIALELGTRFVLVSPDQPAEEDRISPLVFVTRAAPHGWLLPRCSIVVHHGGAGTSFAALRAGKPAVIVWFYGDQPFWGRRFEKLGLGVTLPFKGLTKERLATAIARAGQPAVEWRCAEFAARLRDENGLGDSCKIIEQAIASGASVAAQPDRPVGR
jgi:sterol 3beta-glucosyltransferase